jgi:hypothetical protein
MRAPSLPYRLAYHQTSAEASLLSRPTAGAAVHTHAETMPTFHQDGISTQPVMNQFASVLPPAATAAVSAIKSKPSSLRASDP